MSERRELCYVKKVVKMGKRAVSYVKKLPERIKMCPIEA